MTAIVEQALEFGDRPTLTPRDHGYRDGHAGGDSTPYHGWTDEERRQYRIGWVNGFMAERRETATRRATERRPDHGCCDLPR